MFKVGEGTYTFSDGTTVDAKFKDSRPNGFGVAKFADGLNGFPPSSALEVHTPLGLYIRSNLEQTRHERVHVGTVYEGEFKSGHFHGHGK